MASSLVSLHVAANTEGLATALMWTLEWLLSSVAMAMDSQAAWS